MPPCACSSRPRVPRSVPGAAARARPNSLASSSSSVAPAQSIDRNRPGSPLTAAVDHLGELLVPGIPLTGDEDPGVAPDGARQVEQDFTNDMADRDGRTVNAHVDHLAHSLDVASNCTLLSRLNKPSRNRPLASSGAMGVVVPEITRRSPAAPPSQSNNEI